MVSKKIKVLGIIPARGGSKGIPRKNIKKLCGKPLIAYIIETALKVKKIDRVIVSTEDKEIASIAKKYGAEVPFLRPEKLARNETPTAPVLIHAVKCLENKENYRPDIIALLFATSPMLKPERVSEAINLLIRDNFDSVTGVTEDYGHYWTEKGGWVYPKIFKNRQLVKPLWKENGAMYICTRDFLMKHHSFIGGKIGFVKMKRDETVDIDEYIDFEIAEFLMKKG